jgi:hypothetical protein
LQQEEEAFRKLVGRNEFISIRDWDLRKLSFLRLEPTLSTFSFAEKLRFCERATYNLTKAIFADYVDGGAELAKIELESDGTSRVRLCVGKCDQTVKQEVRGGGTTSNARLNMRVAVQVWNYELFMKYAYQNGITGAQEALQQYGERLVQLPDGQLAYPLPDQR